MKVCVDFDDVLVDTISAWITWLNKKHDLNITHDDIKEWDMRNNLEKYNLTEQQIYEPLFDAEFWGTVKPKSDALEFIRQCQILDLELFICTDTNIVSLFTKYTNCICKLFPMIDWNHIIICHNKEMIVSDIFIDDKTETIFKRCNAFDGESLNLLMTTNANKSDTFLKNRIKSLSEVIPILTSVLGVNSIND